MSIQFKHFPIKDTDTSVSEEMLSEFEKNLPHSLPDDYREFLKRYNGGTMDEECNSFYIQGIPGFTITQPGDEGFIVTFDSLIIEKKNNLEDLLSSYLFFRKEGVFPAYCLPIGSDGGGNLVLLSLGEEDFGHVYFWDHEQGWEEAGSLEPDYSHCYFVAYSFAEFINSLHQTPDDE